MLWLPDLDFDSNAKHHPECIIREIEGAVASLTVHSSSFQTILSRIKKRTGHRESEEGQDEDSFLSLRFCCRCHFADYQSSFCPDHDSLPSSLNQIPMEEDEIKHSSRQEDDVEVKEWVSQGRDKDEKPGRNESFFLSLFSLSLSPAGLLFCDLFLKRLTSRQRSRRGWEVLLPGTLLFSFLSFHPSLPRKRQSLSHRERAELLAVSFSSPYTFAFFLHLQPEIRVYRTEKYTTSEFPASTWEPRGRDDDDDM